jgi:hypothetical protein
MRGAITGRDVLLHPLTIVRGWGVATYLHCLLAAFGGRSSTFLGVLYGTAAGAKGGAPR